jgi:formiminoglutamase
VIPHTAPPFWPPTAHGRFAAAICRNSTELLEDPAAADEARKCRVALLGLADDTGVALNGGRPGAGRGPHALRAALARYGVATPSDDAGPYPRVFDAGDIVPGADMHETHRRVTEATRAVLEAGMFPIAIGGGHDLTFPFVRAVAERYPAMSGVYFDAHLDVRVEVGSGMPFRKLVEDCGVKRLTCIGMNPLANSREHFDWFVRHGGSVAPFAPDNWPSPPHCPDQFVSIDLDCLDGAAAPGVSAPHPAGLAPGLVAQYATAAGRHPNVRCFDIMELNPDHDQDGRTARVAAHLLLCFLRGLAGRAGFGHP